MALQPLFIRGWKQLSAYKYSFYKKDIKDDELVWMREKGNLVFYYDL